MILTSQHKIDVLWGSQCIETYILGIGMFNFKFWNPVIKLNALIFWIGKSMHCEAHSALNLCWTSRNIFNGHTELLQEILASSLIDSEWLQWQPRSCNPSRPRLRNGPNVFLTALSPCRSRPRRPAQRTRSKFRRWRGILHSSRTYCIMFIFT